MVEARDGRSERGATVPAAGGAVRRRAGEGPAALSFSQERLWFVDRLEPGATPYNSVTAWGLSGALRLDALERAIGEIIRRHEVLRTTFAEVDGVPVQVAAPFSGFALRVDDFAATLPAEHDRTVQRCAREEETRPFDLARDVPCRIRLLRLSEREHALVLSIHHIVSDGWSFRVFLRELTTLYDAFASGRESPLDELPVQYADFAAWQRARLSDNRLEEQLAYWRRQLAGAPALLALPTDHPRPPTQRFQGARARAQFPLSTLEGLRALARREAATLYMVLLAGFQALLGRYTDSADVVVGSAVAGRTRPEFERLIGFFANTVVMRTDTSGDPTFLELLRRVRDVALGAYEHQDVPFERVVAELRPERSVSHSPLVQVVFGVGVHGVFDLPRARVDGDPQVLHWRRIPLNAETVMFDMTLSLVPDATGLDAVLTYNTVLFEKHTIQRLLHHLGYLLQQVAADPTLRLSAVKLLDGAEREQVLGTWNATDTAITPQVVHARIAAHAAAAPETVAVTCGSASLRYGELEARANAVAHGLRALGVGPEARVGVLLPRGLDLLVAVLGVWKAGGAYVPLDPTYPVGRLTYMAADAGARVLLTDRAHLSVLPVPDDVQIVDVAQWREPSRVAPVSGVTPGHLAYVLYTSGSTGRPKGVAVEHAALDRYLSWAATAYPSGTAAVHSSLSFDLTVTGLFVPLVTGGCVELIPEPDSLGGLATRLVHEPPLGLLKLTPTHLRALGDLLPAGGAGAGPECVVVGGEALHGEHVAAVRARWPTTTLVNEYGPTETVVGCCVDVRSLAKAEPGPIPIGRPAPNVRLYVLDAAGAPVPVGQAAELYIGGPQQARGYLDRPALTAERFLPDPFGPVAGARLYRTGDRVRWRNDGTLDYLGRRDAQVKIRGFRIELGEVEAALRQQDGVADAVAVVRNDATAEPRVVAYVSGPVIAAAVQAALRQQVPGYLVPAAVVVLDALPRSTNGKLDTRALPAPTFESTETYVAPRTPMEATLAVIWAEVLGLVRVGVTDNFFAIGGHSLLATRIVSRVRELLGVDLPLRVLFELPTVAAVAEQIGAFRQQGGPALPTIQPVARSGAEPLSFAQERLWFLEHLQPGTTAYHVNMPLRLKGTVDVAALERALGEVVRRHEVLRTNIVDLAGVPRQVATPFSGFALSVEDLSDGDERQREHDARRRAAAEATTPFDLAAGPPIRAHLLRLDALDHVLLLSMHHIAVDEWSLGVLFRELTILYDAYRNGRESPLPPLPIQYADYAHWQRAHLDDRALEAHLDYWRTQLAGAPPLIPLPTDHPRPRLQSYRGAQQPVQFPAEWLDRLRAMGRQEGASLFMVLLAALQVVLGKWAATDDVLVGTSIAGRTRHEVRDLIGFFVNTLVLRTRLSKNGTFRDVVRQVRAVTLGAYEHADLPFERLVDELQPSRSLSHAPLCQVRLSLHDAPGMAEPLADVSVEPMPLERQNEKLDLSLSLTPTSNGLTGRLSYSTDLFDRVTIQRLLAHLTRFIDQVIENPDVAVSELTLLDPAERAHVLEACNQTDVARPSSLVHERFAEIVAQSPDKVAATCQGSAITYRELNAWADRLASRLRRLGVTPEARVGICLERGLQMVAAVLGVLKAGGAYVPLDPACPAARLEQIATDADVRAVLTHSAIRNALRVNAEVPVIDVNGAIQDELGDVLPGAPVSADGLAYVLYTSGSTGIPKGVAVTHAALANYLAWAGETYPSRTSVVHTTLSFDFTLTNLLVPLLCGGCVEIIPETNALERLVDRLTSGEPLALLKVTPAHLQALEPLISDAPSTASAVACVVIGGEALFGEQLDAFRARFPDATIVNEYGPTETVVGCCIETRLLRDTTAGAVPIGRPVSNTRLYVLDEVGLPVPMGTPGELYIGGIQVARGYLNRPGQTAACFVPDAFAPAAGARLYRTGDVVRRLPDGSLAYLGRTDAQVKINGFRIEPREIETVLRQCDGVTDCAVVARTDGRRAASLVAYVTGRAGVDRLREHARQQLPRQMVPARFVQVDRWPLTANGKLDVKALPAPDVDATDDRYVAPRTAVEHTLAAIWAEVLRVERVGVETNFFAGGGDSILSIQVVARARRAGLQVSAQQMFEYQTIAELASVVESAGAPTQMERPPVDGSAPLAPIQAWFFEQDHAAPHHYNQSMLIDVDPAIADTTLSAALDAVSRHHDAFRLRFRRVTDRVQQWYAETSSFPLESVDLVGLEPDEQDCAQEDAANRAHASLELERGPLARALLFDRGDRRLLLLVLHHLIVDGVSWRILREDLESACARIGAGETAALEGKTTPCGDWSALLQTYAESAALRHEAAYWLAQGRTSVPALPVHGDGQRGGARRSVVVKLSPEETRALLRDVPAAHGTQINDALLCALADAVRAWTGHSRLRVLLEGHGRDAAVGGDADLTRSVGWFTTHFPVVLNASDARDAGERLHSIKDQLRSVPNRGVGYGVLRYLCRDAEIRGQLASQPEPELSFNYLGQFDGGVSARTRLRFATGPRGRASAPQNRSGHLIEVTGRVDRECLRLTCSYDDGGHRRERVERFAASYLAALRALLTDTGAAALTATAIA